MGWITWLRQRLGLADAVFLEIDLPEVSGRLYVSPMPFGPYDKLNQLLGRYREAGVEFVVPLVTDEEIDRKAKRDLLGEYKRAGIQAIRFPIRDLTSPSVEAVCKLVQTVAPYLRAGACVAVHCNAGVGRTAVIVACLVAEVLEMDGRDATEYVEARMATRLIASQKRVILKFSDLPAECCQDWLDTDLLPRGKTQP